MMKSQNKVPALNKESTALPISVCAWAYFLILEDL